MTDIRDQLPQHIPRLRRYARRLARDESYADDLVQGTLVRAIGKQHLYKQDVDLRAWLFTILHNEHVNTIRKRVRRGDSENVENVIIPVQEGVTSTLMLRDIKCALEKLPPDQLRIIMLVGVEGMKYEEVAKILGVPVGTVRSRLWRARSALQEILQWKPLRKAPHSRANEPPHKPESGLSSEKPQHKHCIVSQNALVSSVSAPEPGSVHGSISTKNNSKIKEMIRG